MRQTEHAEALNVKVLSAQSVAQDKHNPTSLLAKRPKNGVTKRGCAPKIDVMQHTASM